MKDLLLLLCDEGSSKNRSDAGAGDAGVRVTILIFVNSSIAQVSGKMFTPTFDTTFF